MQTLAQNQQLTVKQIDVNNNQLKGRPKELEKKNNLRLTYLSEGDNYSKGEFDYNEGVILKQYGCL